MKRHRIRVKIEFEEIDSEIEDVNCEPQKVEDGCFEIDLYSARHQTDPFACVLMR